MTEMLDSKCPIDNADAFPNGIKLGNYDIYECIECHHHFAAAALNETINYNNVYDSDEYKKNQIDSFAREVNLNRFDTIGTYKPFFKVFRKHERLSLLDVGCGVGRFCHAAFNKGWQVKGIDISKRAIDIAVKFARFPVEVKLIKEEIHKYNVIAAFEVLEHLADPMEFLAEIKSHLLPIGKVFMTVPNWDCDEVRSAIRPDWLPPIHLQFYSERSLKKLFETAGYKNLRSGYVSTNSIPESLKDFLYWIVTLRFLKPATNIGIWIYGEA